MSTKLFTIKAVRDYIESKGFESDYRFDEYGDEIGFYNPEGEFSGLYTVCCSYDAEIGRVTTETVDNAIADSFVFRSSLEDNEKEETGFDPDFL